MSPYICRVPLRTYDVSSLTPTRRLPNVLLMSLTREAGSGTASVLSAASMMSLMDCTLAVGSGGVTSAPAVATAVSAAATVAAVTVSAAATAESAASAAATPGSAAAALSAPPRGAPI